MSTIDETADVKRRLSRRLHPVMADAPFAPRGVAEQAGGGEKEPAPAPHPERGLLAIDAAQDGFDLGAMRVEIGKPVERRAPIMLTAPSPLLLDRKQVGILPDQTMTRHHAAGEEVLRD